MNTDSLADKVKGFLAGFMESKAGRAVFAVVERYTDDDVPTKAAALVYYFIFSIFPVLILLGNILGLMDLDYNAIGKALAPIMPYDIIQLLSGYLQYVHDSFSPTLFTFSIVFSIYFPFRVVKELMSDIRQAYGLPKRKNFIAALLRPFICTLLMPFAIFLSIVLILMGSNVITFFVDLLPKGTIDLSGFLLGLWQYLRFVVAALIMGFALTLLYGLSLNGRPKLKNVAPGVVTALILWVIACIAFSFYVENFAHYSVLYGTLGAFIVLLLWLYLTSVVFIMGGEINALIDERSRYHLDLDEDAADDAKKEANRLQSNALTNRQGELVNAAFSPSSDFTNDRKINGGYAMAERTDQCQANPGNGIVSENWKGLRSDEDFGDSDQNLNKTEPELLNAAKPARKVEIISRKSVFDPGDPWMYAAFVGAAAGVILLAKKLIHH